MATALVAVSEDMKALRSSMKLAHDAQQSVERFRIQIGNRIGAVERGVDNQPTEVLDYYRDFFEDVQRREEELDALIARLVKRFPVWNYWLKNVKGIGPSLAGQLLAMLLPVHAELGPSTWYKAAGLAPELQADGQMRLPRPKEVRCPECNGNSFSNKTMVDTETGEEHLVKTCRSCKEVLPSGYGKITWYPALRRCLYNLATSFVRTGGYYREQYDSYKLYLQGAHANDEKWPPIRLDRVARWHTVKLFLSHLWEMTCEAEGISEHRRAYVLDKLNHQHYIPAPVSQDGKKI
jgi:hypothetical protein